MIIEKGSLLKHLRKQFCTCICSLHVYLCIYSSCTYTKLFSICFNSGLFRKSHHKCFARCGSSLQFRLHITKSSMYNLNFQYTQDKLSVLDICVEKEEILLLWQQSMSCYTCWLDRLKMILTGVVRSLIEQSVQLVEERTGDMIDWLGWWGGNHLDSFWW